MRFTKVAGNRWAVIDDELGNVGVVFDNGARRTYGRHWSAKRDGAETRHPTRQFAGEALVRRARAAARLTGDPK